MKIIPSRAAKKTSPSESEGEREGRQAGGGAAAAAAIGEEESKDSRDGERTAGEWRREGSGGASRPRRHRRRRLSVCSAAAAAAADDDDGPVATSQSALPDSLPLLPTTYVRYVCLSVQSGRIYCSLNRRTRTGRG